MHEVVGKEAEDLCRHDKWLCMMYPRLMLLKDFLANDGILFVSIDDNELHNCRLLLDEMFRPQNLLACFVWQTDGNPAGPGLPRVVYGEACRLGEATLARQNVIFRQTPYALKER
jgi:hypothetical protein